MDIKTLAGRVKQLAKDETFLYIIESIKKDQANIFLNPNSSFEERESSHEIIRGLSKIEGCMASILTDEAIFDRKHH